MHTGTITSKTLRGTALKLSVWHERSSYGCSYRVKGEIQAKDLKSWLHKTLDYQVDVRKHQFNRNHEYTLLSAARFVGGNRLEVATKVSK